MKKYNVIFFGTPEFAVPSLEALYRNEKINILKVISQPDRPAGRGHQLKSPEVIEFAKENNIPYFQTENINKHIEELEEADFYVVLAFAQFLNSKILNKPKIGCFNIHTSILPKYRGAAPIQYAILNGDTSTGVSIQKMVKKMDAGDLVYFSEVKITENQTGGELYDVLKNEAAKSLNAFIDILDNDKIKYTPQNENNVSFAPTLKKEDGRINFLENKASTIFNQIRELFPWPGTYFDLKNKRIKVLSAEISNISLKPNEIDIKHNALIIGCNEGSIQLNNVQVAGKKPCHSKDLINGLRGEIKIG